MRKNLLILTLLFCFSVFSQNTNWTLTNKKSIRTNKNVTRSNFPENFILFSTNSTSLKNQFQNAPQRLKANDSNVILEIPNSKGTTERFKIFEFSNFEKQLQDAFPEIRSYVGIGIDDTSAQVRISLDPKGMQAMIFRGNKNNEFIEPYSDDLTTYAVYESQRNKGELPFSCSTEDTSFANRVATDVNNANRSGAGELLIFRLALSSTSEYAAYFGATNSSQWSLVLAAYNATMTRVNGVFEKDFSIHMNITTNSQNVAYYNASTDPYSNASTGAGGAWNGELQSTLTSVLGESTYDVGHLFGASGGGGNAGCIGCVCVDGIKGRGFTSPSNGVPMGDTFDIDYVAHELGHQFGGNHTFSHNIEGTGVNVEPGSGSTIMGYAGITSYDVQAHSDDYFVYASIKQVQDNMVGKTCPNRVTLTNITPTVNAGIDYTIPKSTPFILTGTGADGNGDTLTYTWEQNDTATTQSAANSAASATKTIGPNWRSYSPTTSPTRYFPPLSRVIANQNTTTGLDITVEAISSIARTLNFVLTARDNFAGAGQTASDAMVVTVNGTVGPFAITVPNTNVNWTVGSNRTITWNVSGTTANGINCASVDIYLSTDGGNTYPILLASEVPNDGSQVVTIPNNVGATNRIMIKGNKHIFYDISNTNFTITNPTSTFSVSFNGVEGEQNKKICSGNTAEFYVNYKIFGGFSANTSFSVTGQPTGSTVTFSPTSISADGTVTMTISNTQNVSSGNYVMIVTGTSGSTSKTVEFFLTIFNGVFTTQTLVAPSNLAFAQETSLNLNWSSNSAATLYTLQVATDEDFTNIIVNSDVTTTTYSLSGLSELTNYFWKVLPKNQGCSGAFSEVYRFTTKENICNTYNSVNVPLTITTAANVTVNSTLTIPTNQNVSISDVNVSVNITHTWVSDLTVTLISPNNTQIQLVALQCSSNDNINATFDDQGVALVCGATPTISGFVIPAQSLSALNGQNSQGIWTLRVLDSASGDGGSLNNWSLQICSSPTTPPTCGQLTTVWNGTSWSNGKPSDNVATTINGNYNINENIKMCSLDIIGTSQVTVSSGKNLEITNGVNIATNANLTIENNANLIQVNNTVNTGNAVVRRNSNPLMRLDYTIWSSPIVSAQTLKNFSPSTLNNRFYSYNTDTNVYYTIDPLSQLFETGNGYLIRMPDNHPTTATIWNGEFNGGVLNNGTITKNIDYVSATQNFNIIGNPYPSTIDADDFITNNTASIFGTLYFWRKINNAAGSAYATYTLGGGTTTSPTSPTPNGTIQVGQGFFVQAKNVGNPTVSFTNAIRKGNNENQFFRTNTELEKHRIWLNLTNNDGFFHQILVGFMTNATNDFDTEIDGKYINDNGTALSSLLNDDEYTIQLKGLPFNDEATFPLLFKSTAAGNFTIGIDHLDGLFESDNQSVFLIDHLLQTTNNLNNGNYNFSTNEGLFPNRFEIVFREQALNNNAFDSNSIVLYSNNNQLFISSGNEEMNKITIYDALGRMLNTFDNINTTLWNTAVVSQRNQVLLVTIQLTNGMSVTKKMVY